MRTPATKPHSGPGHIVMYLVTAAPFAPVYIVVFGILALTIGLTTGDGGLGIFIFFVGPAILHGILIAIGHERTKKAVAETWNKAYTALDHVDYFHAFADEGIAIDAGAKKIALLKRAPKKPKNLECTVIDYDDIKDYSYQVVTPDEYKADGFYNPHQFTVETKNFAEKVKASKNTGIIIVPKGITSTEYLVNMKEKDIKVWIKILESAFAGELEPTERPVDTVHV